MTSPTISSRVLARIDALEKKIEELAKRVDKLLAAIKSAMDAGDLPLPHDVGRRERGMYIHNTVAAHLKKLTEAEAAAKAE